MSTPSGGLGVQWYYEEGNTRRGPVDTTMLLEALRATEDPRMVRVWREGLADWERAGAQPELRSHLPPRMLRPVTIGADTFRSSLIGDTVTAAPAMPRLNPWLSMWTKPRETIRQIIETDPEHLTAVVAALSGIATTLDRASSRDFGDRMPLAAVLGMAVIVGAVGGVIGVRLGAVLVEFTGNWLGGRGIREHIRAALAWGSVPTAWMLVPWAIVLLIAGGDLFTAETPYLDEHPGLALLTLVPLLVILVMAIWSPFVLSKALAEVQGFSAWRALGNVLLAGLVVAVPFLALAAVTLLVVR
jgi:hypothetical protein